MPKEQWFDLVPNYTNAINSALSKNLASISSYWQLQAKANVAIKRFVSLGDNHNFMLVNAPDLPEYRSVFREFCDLEPTVSESLDAECLFGHYFADANGDIVSINNGLLEQSQLIVLSAAWLIKNHKLWSKLRSSLHNKQFTPLEHKRSVGVANHLPVTKTTAKVIFVGDREQLADIEAIEPESFSGLMSFAEIELETKTSEENITGLVEYFSNKYQVSLTCEAWNELFIQGSRITEDHNYLPLDLNWYQSIFAELKFESGFDDNSIDLVTVQKVFGLRSQANSYLTERARADILDGQVIIETEGKRVGQVNGLTIIDVPGHPTPYGEPARISCVIHFGDGDVNDVERKADLGGNLHAKGMMIMQAYVSSALNLDEPLPYSASVVFEQSYCEVDGDSATLAELCSFVSALSEYPVNQNVAVTGAVDQFGRVQAVGGLNEKIESFYRICEHRGLTGEQGVILPASNLKHITLNRDVLESIAEGRFHIWSVSTVEEAIPLLLDQPFSDGEESVINKIAQRIDNYNRPEEPQTLLSKIKNWRF